MNLDKYEEISGLEAIKQLLDGKEVYTSKGEKYYLDLEINRLCYVLGPMYGESFSVTTVNDVLRDKWYIPKPFDVRQAMLDRPNEWVGAFESNGYWWKVGLDMNFIQAVVARYDVSTPVDFSERYVNAIDGLNLKTCIPIEDVPEEATR